MNVGANRLPDDMALAACVEALLSGEPIIIPTDTVYGLAALATDEQAVAALFELKERSVDLSIVALVAGLSQADELANMTLVSPLVEAHWPGALTVVVPKRPGCALVVGADDGTVGLRAPAHPFVRALAQRVGPLAATSANKSGQPTAETAQAAAEVFGTAVALVVDGGELVGQASTVAKVTSGADGPELTVFREGGISTGTLQATLDRDRT